MAFVSGTPPQQNFAPFNHVANQIPLDEGVTTASIAPTDAAQAGFRRPGRAQRSDLVRRDRLQPAFPRREHDMPPVGFQESSGNRGIRRRL